MPLLAVTLPLALTVVAATAPTKLPPCILPVVDMLPDPNVPPAAVTLPVTDTNPPVKLAVFTMVVNIPLLAVILPVVLTGLEPKAAKLATTLALPYELTIPVSADPLPTKKLPVTLPVTDTVLPV